MLKLCACAGALLLSTFAVRAPAASPAQPISSYLRTRFTKEDGLPSGSVNVILQTRNGFLWVGTNAGLVRFDGSHFTTIAFSPQTPTEGLSRALAEGRDGDLWAGTNRGVLRIPKAALDQFGPLPSISYAVGKEPTAIAVLHVSSDGTVWAGGDFGLYRFNGEAFSAVISNRSISRIEEASNGHLLIVTPEGLVEWDGSRIVEHPSLAARLGVANNKIYHVMEDHTGVRWYCTAAGVAREIHGAIERLQPYGVHVAREAYRAYEDLEGNVWLNLGGSLFRATTAGFEPVPGERARYIYADRDGDLWLGSAGEGLVRLKHRRVRMFTTADGLPSNSTLTVLTDSGGRLWVGSNCGLSLFDGLRFRSFSEKDGLTNSCVYALAEDGKKDIWAGSYGGGVFRFHNGRFTQFSKPEGLPSDVVTSILPASDGSLWFATPNGISRMQDGHFRNYSRADGLSSALADNLYEDRRGVIWAAMSGGLDRLSAGHFKAISQSPEVRDYKLLWEDSSGIYGVAPPLGIFRVDGDRLVGVAKSPKASGMIQFEGELWLCGDGISRAAPDSFRQWEHNPQGLQEYVRYGPGDGLLSTECSTSLPNLAVTGGRKLWAAMLGGLAMLDLPQLTPDNRKPTVYIQEITVGQTSLPPGHELVVQPGPHHVELHFGAIELASPEKIRMQYRLDDEQEWLDAGTPGIAIYSSFPVGAHTFHVRACNSDGVWDKAGIVYNITQLPYYYETKLFRLAAVAILGLLLAGAYRLRLRRLTAEMSARLDERVLERTRLARELHDTLLQTIEGSKMMADAGLEDPADAARLYRTLERVSNWLAQATQEGRAALRALRSSAAERDDLAQALEGKGRSAVFQGSMSFALEVEGSAREMHPIVRDEVYLIACEAMRNARFHSKGTQLGVRLSYSRDLVLRVSDNGEGIDSDIVFRGKEGHFGIRGMQERAARLGAKLRFHSTSSGTEVELVVPGNLAFRDAKALPSGPLAKLRKFFRADA